MSTETFKLESERVVRFVALAWNEDWEFDHPTVLLEPIRKYSPWGRSPVSVLQGWGRRMGRRRMCPSYVAEGNFIATPILKRGYASLRYCN